MRSPEAAQSLSAVGGRAEAWSTASVVSLLVATVVLPRALLFPFNENWFGDAIIRCELAERLIARPHWIGSFDQGAYQFGPLHIYLVALAAKLWNSREHAGRLVSLIAAALTVLPLYALTQKLFGRREAITACLCFALWGMHVQFSTTASSEAVGLLLVMSAVACFAHAFESERVGPLVGAAVFVNLACATRYDAWLLVPLLAGLLVWFSANRRRAAERAVVLCVMCLPFPLVWMAGNYADRADPLYPLRFIDDFHRHWFPDGEAAWGKLNYRLQNLVFWPAVALVTLSPLVAVFGFTGLGAAWRTRRDTRWLVLLIAIPTALFTFRSTVTGSFVPLARFAAKEVLLLLPFVGLGGAVILNHLPRSARGAVVGLAVAMMVLLPASLAAFTFHREGKYEDMLRPISPTSTQPQALMQVAHFLRDEVGAKGEAYILDSDPKQYRDLTLAFFSGLPEERIARHRWEIFDLRLITAEPRYLVRIEGGTLESSGRLHVEGPVARFRPWEFQEVSGFQPPFHVYRR